MVSPISGDPMRSLENIVQSGEIKTAQDPQLEKKLAEDITLSTYDSLSKHIMENRERSGQIKKELSQLEPGDPKVSILQREQVQLQRESAVLNQIMQGINEKVKSQMQSLG